MATRKAAKRKKAVKGRKAVARKFGALGSRDLGAGATRSGRVKGGVIAASGALSPQHAAHGCPACPHPAIGATRS
jgi:hypothetical protein